MTYTISKTVMLEHYANENGHINCRFFIDDRVSGTTFERKGFQDMICEIENGNEATMPIEIYYRFVGKIDEALKDMLLTGRLARTKDF